MFLVCPALLRSRSGMASYLCLGATSALVPDAFKFKTFETQLSATYNKARAVRYYPF